MVPGYPGLNSRPRPPANRRPSSQLRRTFSTSTQEASENAETQRPDQQPLLLLGEGDGRGKGGPSSASHLAPPTATASEYSSSSHGRGGLVLDRDLDLDLPDDLTVALERNLQRWPKGCGRMASASRPSTTAASASAGASDQARTVSYGSLGRTNVAKVGHEGSVGGVPEGTRAAHLQNSAGGRPRPSMHYVFSTPERQRRAAKSERATQNTPDPTSPPLEIPVVPTASLASTTEQGAAAAIAGSESANDGVAATTGNAHDRNENGDDGSDTHSLVSDASSFDQEWVGGLGRDELEALLMQANRVIKEREKDLVMAAAIGKALLEKNISLRQKHTGIASRLASSTSIFDMARAEAGFAIDGAPSSDQRQPCSPPTTDTDLTTTPAAGEIATPATSTIDDEKTPMAAGTALSRSGTVDYFGHATLMTLHRTVASGAKQPLSPMLAAPQHTTADGGTGSGQLQSTMSRPSSLEAELSKPQLQTTPTLTSSGGGNPWIPSEAGLIHSQPPSPTGSIGLSASFRGFGAFDAIDGPDTRQQHRSGRGRPMLSQMQATEAQRQLAQLSQQNEALLQQLSELQEEAERAKREGSKKLGRLDKEIGGLKTELEAATRRNIELEQSKLHARIDADSVDVVGLSQKKKAWTKGKGAGPISPLLHGTMNLGLQASLTPVRNSYLSAEDIDLAGGRSGAPKQRLSASQSSTHTDASSAIDDEAACIPISASDLEEMLGYRPGNSEGEQELVARLLAKIQELRETNRVMAEAGTEMDSKLGRAMEEGERLKDAYDAVESSSVVPEDWTCGGDHDFRRDGTASPVGQLRPGEAAGGSESTSLRGGGSGPMTPSGSHSNLDLLDLPPASLGSLSPSLTRRRRAPGNRYTIETRKTIRAALRRERQQLMISDGGGGTETAFGAQAGGASGMSRSGPEDSLGSYSLDLSQSSSAASSPNSRRIIRKVSGTSIGVGAAARPRIRITPSIEDLGARRKTTEVTIGGANKEAKAGGTSSDGETGSSKVWEDVPLSSPTSGRPSFGSANASLKPSDALNWVPSKRKQQQQRERRAVGQRSPRSVDDDQQPSSPLGRSSSAAVRGFYDSDSSVASPNASPNASPISAERSMLSSSTQLSTSTARASPVRGDGPSSQQHLPVTSERPSGLASYSGFSLSSVPSMSRSSSASNIGDADWALGRTLGSELGSIFGGDDRRCDFSFSEDGVAPGGGGDGSVPTVRGAEVSSAVEGPLRLSDLEDEDGGDGSSQITLETVASPAQLIRYKKSGRPTASFGRLVPDDVTDEDQEDIECVLQHIDAVVRLQSPSPQDERDSSLIAVFADDDDGVWRAGDDIVEKAGLKDLEQPRGDQYDLICTAVEEQPVHWADDDDFGRPITETEALRIGLMQLPLSYGGRTGGAKTLRGKWKSSVLLGLAWAAGKKLATGSAGQDGGGAAARRHPSSSSSRLAPPRLQIESEELTAERRKLEELLRRRRIDVLRSRGYDADDGDESDGYGLEAEVDARVLAILPARHRLRAEKAHASRASYLGEGRKLDFGRLEDDSRSQPGTNKTKGKGKQRLVELNDDPSRDQPIRDLYTSRPKASATSPPVARRRTRRDMGAAQPAADPSRVAREGSFSGSMRDWARATTTAAAASVMLDPQLDSEADAASPDESETSSDFELMEPPTAGGGGGRGGGAGTVSRRIKRQGERGTDYYPISLRARYQPSMVKQRVKVASNEAIVWISTWVTFTTVIIFAFVVAVRRGPAPVLGTGGNTGTSIGASRRGAGQSSSSRRRTTSIGYR